MWQRFTERARRIVFFAQEEAGRLGENYVSTEHLLLGLVRENDSVAARILDRMGVSLGRIRSEIESQVTRGDGRLGQDMQLTPRAKRVIDLAYDEARQLSNNYIGTEHLLLGLIRENEELAGRVLSKLGVDLQRTRREVMALQDNDSGIAPSQKLQDLQNSKKDFERLRQEFMLLQDSDNEKAKSDLESRLRDLEASLQANESENAANMQVGEPAQQYPEYFSKVKLQSIILADAAGWRKRSLLTLWDVSPEQIGTLLDVASGMKKHDLARESSLYWEYPRTLAMLFEKPSLRTRVSFEVSMAHLEGHAVYLSPDDVGLGTRESIADVALALSRWVDIISARVFKHETVLELDQHASIPVINALSDREHPVQAFADLLTLREHKGTLGNNLKLAYVGDGNNVLHALLLACAKTGVNLSAACPEGYTPNADYVAEALRIGQETGAQIEILTDPVAAVSNADAVYTDVWASMGQEAEKEQRAALFAPYQLNSELMNKAKPDAIAMHCLPAHRGEEISGEVMETYKIPIFDQAENRLHTQKALLVLILGL